MNVRECRSASLLKMTLLVTFAVLCAAPVAFAQPSYKFDAATVSGLPARNIGSATMSGRIAALDAVEQDGRITVFVGAASGGVWKSVMAATYKPVFDRETLIDRSGCDRSVERDCLGRHGRIVDPQQRVSRRRSF
jgi:hypothetical protein